MTLQRGDTILVSRALFSSAPVENLLQVVRSADLPHSFTDVPDLVAAMIAPPGNRSSGTGCCMHPPIPRSPSGK
jgi:hypothetical protein